MTYTTYSAPSDAVKDCLTANKLAGNNNYADYNYALANAYATNHNISKAREHYILASKSTNPSELSKYYSLYEIVSMFEEDSKSTQEFCNDAKFYLDSFDQLDLPGDKVHETEINTWKGMCGG